jgi:RpiR family carbohydrate utilization transcriptional regulator
VALDGQHKFFRLGLATSASSDPHVHSMSAALLCPQDVVIAISASGRTLDLIHTIRIARNAGAYIVGLTDRGSPLTQVCDAILPVDVRDSPVANAPTTSRLLHLAVLDMLAVLVAERLGPDLRKKAEQARAVVIGKRSPAVAEAMK